MSKRIVVSKIVVELDQHANGNWIVSVVIPLAGSDAAVMASSHSPDKEIAAGWALHNMRTLFERAEKLLLGMGATNVVVQTPPKNVRSEIDSNEEVFRADAITTLKEAP